MKEIEGTGYFVTKTGDVFGKKGFKLTPFKVVGYPRITISHNRKCTHHTLCEAYDTGIFTLNDIAKHYGVSISTIHKIVKGIWKYS